MLVPSARGGSGDGAKAEDFGGSGELWPSPTAGEWSFLSGSEDPALEIVIPRVEILGVVL